MEKDKLEKGFKDLFSIGRKDINMIFSDRQEFVYIEIDKIITDEQVRYKIDTESKDFQMLYESIKSEGILNPVVVIKKGDNYLLVAGHRRYEVAKMLNLDLIPARIIEDKDKNQILKIQLIENLHRERLSPIDLAEAFSKYYEQKHNNASLLKDLHFYARKRELLSEDKIKTINEIVAISGKSYRTLINFLRLLILPEEVKIALKERKISVSVGYKLNQIKKQDENKYKKFIHIIKKGNNLKYKDIA